MIAVIFCRYEQGVYAGRRCTRRADFKTAAFIVAARREKLPDTRWCPAIAGGIGSPDSSGTPARCRVDRCQRRKTGIADFGPTNFLPRTELTVGGNRAATRCVGRCRSVWRYGERAKQGRKKITISHRW